MYGGKRRIPALAVMLAVLSSAMPAHAADTDMTELQRQYREYEERLEKIEHTEDLAENGWRVFEEQTSVLSFESFGEEELTFLPAVDTVWERLAVFLADTEGNIVYKSDRLETNNRPRGSLKQSNLDVSAVSFTDANRDGLIDIILITRCVNDSGDYAGIPYKVGDVLFQGERSFYQDWRISDKINRFSMNKNANFVISFVQYGNSTEFLYTASTLEELLKNGFTIIEEQCYTRQFEKLGRLKVVPGTAKFSWCDIFMIYLVNDQGDIVWSFQPMRDYDGLYALKGIQGRDLDGDGMKDLVVLARYSREDDSGERIVESRCSICYQRTGGFDVDTEFENYYRCTDEDTVNELVTKIREYWGWQVEDD